jgi:Uri superfamily endonuclease
MATAGKGVYLLLLSLPIPSTISIGRLGNCSFPAGYYLYVGSAHGPGGLSARLDRHIRREKRMHWHIDYLRSVAKLNEIWLLANHERAECRLAAATLTLPDAQIPVARFGASDCRCPSHLIYVPARPTATDLATTAKIPTEQIQVIVCDETGN